MINIIETRPNYRHAITCLNCDYVVDANARGHVLVLECTKHENWCCESHCVCNDHPMLKPIEKANPDDIEIIDDRELNFNAEIEENAGLTLKIGEIPPGTVVTEENLNDIVLPLIPVLDAIGEGDSKITILKKPRSPKKEKSDKIIISERVKKKLKI